MAKSHALPLQERVSVNNTLQRLSDALILSLFLSLLAYRLASLHRHGTAWLVAFVCESWFAFVWFLFLNARWNRIFYRSHPQHLTKTYSDLPAVDMFVTTADPTLEPPIITVDTVLSLLAVDYPVHKLACYVSDDGASPVTFHSLSESVEFAKLWVPFCKKHEVRVRAPSVYFSTEPQGNSSADFIEEWRHVKNEYEELSRRVASVNEDQIPYHRNEEFKDFFKIETKNHPSIVKILWENTKGSDGVLPHLIYVAREKRPKHPHHYKAGAMNVLTRVSGVMTNAPFVLNVDCDMFANNPQVILHAMCRLLGSPDEVNNIAFAQAPQQFHRALKDDPFGNQLVVLQQSIMPGIQGIQGPFYAGTGCFQRRKVIYGVPPNGSRFKNKSGRYISRLQFLECSSKDNSTEMLSHEEFRLFYGNSMEFMHSAVQITAGISSPGLPADLSSRVAVAKMVASCSYEFNTAWGDEIGWVYGSMTEDILTGLRCHSMGWRTVSLMLDPPAFLGSAPVGGPASMTQYKRWATGLLEILVSKKSPVVSVITKELMLRQCLAYLLILVWALRSIVEVCYALLPAYCLLSNSTFLPKTSEVGFVVALALFVTYNIYTLVEYFRHGLSVRAWWNNQRMLRIYASTAWLLGFFSVVLKILGISDTIFEITRKDQQRPGEDVDEVDDPGRFTFDSSPAFVPGTAIMLVNLWAFAVGSLRVLSTADAAGAVGPGIGEFVCSGWILLCFWPFLKGLGRRGRYGIPWSVIGKAMVIVCLFLQFCKTA
ncbi:cellulose synthase-like protein H1 isoform X2 [Curcuma longa]|uniref:cellulose synthase-like protein H1 isoform X2 n=1 Tax=Curcuma longa TaxID=136217 RepID=UPI003D9F819E